MRYSLMISIVLIAFTGIANAERKAVQEFVYDVPSLPYVCANSPFGDVCQHMFGGRRTRIVLSSVPDEVCANITVQLYQLSERLEAAIGNPVPLTACTNVVLDIPVVKALTYFRISRVFVWKGKLPYNGPVPDPHSVMIAVYPDNNFADLIEWSAKNQLVIHDRRNQLTPFLDKQGVTYSTVLPAVNAQQKQVCIWLPDSEPEGDRYDCKAMIVLHEHTDTLPIVYSRINGGRHILDVYTPLIPTLGTHPLTQRMFIQLIQSSLTGEQS